MTLIKTSLLNSTAVVAKMLALFGMNKVLAVYVGPSGYATIGQFQNAVQTITTVATGAINAGIIKYTAEYDKDQEKLLRLWKTSGTISLFCAIFTASLVAFFRSSLSHIFLKNNLYDDVFLWLSLSLIPFAFNSLLLGILNGKKEISLYVAANIFGSMLSFIISATLAIKFKLHGALLALAIHQSLSFFVTLYLCCKATWFHPSYLIGSFDRKIASNLLKFTAMTLTSAACMPMSHVLIRNHLGETFGWSSAGHWEAIWRLSSAYLMLATTTLSVYYLPRLSELKNPKDIRHEIIRGYKIILPITIVCSSSIYILRDFIINLLFTLDFSPMREFFAWQMLGDTLKIGGWILGYLILGKAMTKTFIFIEVIFAIGFVSFTQIFTSIYGPKGATIAYAMNYFLCWIFMALIVKSKLQTPWKEKEI